MFDNIGGKIKTLATSVCVIGIIASVIGAVALWASGNKYNDTVLSGLIVLGVGCLVSWVGSFFAYGFGELIEQNNRILTTNQSILQQLSFPYGSVTPAQQHAPKNSSDAGQCSPESSDKKSKPAEDPNWIKLKDNVFKCPICGELASIDYLIAKRKCPECTQPYIPR